MIVKVLALNRLAYGNVIALVQSVKSNVSKVQNAFYVKHVITGSILIVLVFLKHHMTNFY